MLPVRIAGTPVGVQLARLDALRNHVLTPASRAKPGYRSSLIVPSPPMIVAAGSSSRMITTTGPSSSGTDTAPSGVGRTVTDHHGRRLAEEQERADEEEVRRRQVGGEQPGGLEPPHEPARRDRQPERCHGHQPGRIDPECAQRRQHEGGGEDGGHPSQHHRSGAPVHERRADHEEDPDHRRHQGDGRGEHDDLRRGVVAGDEELGVAADDVEQRLGDGQSTQAEDDEGGR